MFYEQAYPDAAFEIPPMPLDALVTPPEGPEPAEYGSTMYAGNGLVVIGSEYASSSNKVMMFTAANGSIAAVAFDNGDNNWQDEVTLAWEGVACVAAVAGTLGGGPLSPVLGVAAAATCGLFLTDLGYLAYDYGQNSVANNYYRTVTVNLDGNNTNYITYTYSTGYYTTTYNPDTGEYTPFVWHWKTGPQ